MNQKVKALVEQCGGQYYEDTACATRLVDGCYVFERQQLEELVWAVLKHAESLKNG